MSILQRIPLPQRIDVDLYKQAPMKGKTRYALEQHFLSTTNQRVAYLTHSHDQLTDVRGKFLSQVTLAHWEGKMRQCPLNIEGSKDWLIQSLESKGFTAGRICQFFNHHGFCSKKTCPAKGKGRFNKIIAPWQYLTGKRLASFNPRVLILDDVPLDAYQRLLPYKDMNNHWYDLKERLLGLKQKECLVALEDERISTFKDYYSKLIPLAAGLFQRKMNEFSLKDLLLSITAPPPIRLKKKYEKGERAREEWSSTRYKFIFNLRGQRLPYYKRFLDCHGSKGLFKRVPCYPLIFDFFNYLRKNPECQGLLLGASSKPYIHLLKDLAARYDNEYHTKIVFNNRDIPERFKVKKGTVYQYYLNEGKETFYTLQSFQEGGIHKRLEMISLLTEDILATSLNKKIGFITWKKYSPELAEILKRELKPQELPTLTFGNVKGSNAMEAMDLLIIAGTFQVPPTAVINKFNALYNQDIPLNLKGIKDTNTGKYTFDLPDLNSLQSFCNDYEIYQTVYRARGVPVLAFCYLPQQVHEELKVEKRTIKQRSDSSFHVEHGGFPEWADFLAVRFFNLSSSFVSVKEAFTIVKEAGLYYRSYTQFKRDCQRVKLLKHSYEKQIDSKRGRPMAVLSLRRTL